MCNHSLDQVRLAFAAERLMAAGLDAETAQRLAAPLAERFPNPGAPLWAGDCRWLVGLLMQVRLPLNQVVEATQSLLRKPLAPSKPLREKAVELEVVGLILQKWLMQGGLQPAAAGLISRRLTEDSHQAEPGGGITLNWLIRVMVAGQASSDFIQKIAKWLLPVTDDLTPEPGSQREKVASLIHHYRLNGGMTHRR